MIEKTASTKYVPKICKNKCFAGLYLQICARGLIVKSFEATSVAKFNLFELINTKLLQLEFVVLSTVCLNGETAVAQQLECWSNDLEVMGSGPSEGWAFMHLMCFLSNFIS